MKLFFSTTENSTSSNTSQIFDMKHFQQVFNDAHVCSENGRLEFIADTSPAVGLYHQNTIRCTKCGKETMLSKFPPTYPIEAAQQEPNKCLTIAVATNGIGYNATKTIMSALGLSVTSEKTFLYQLHKYYDALHIFATQRFQSIIHDIKLKNNSQDKILNVAVSLDGTWKRRVHVSNYGIVFLVHADSGKCIDYEVLSLICEKCNMKRVKLSSKEFKKWFIKHKPFCYKNHRGTSKSMEKEGTIKLFQRSLINGLRYKFMICDGDSTAYEAVKYYYINQQQQQLLEGSSVLDDAAETSDDEGRGLSGEDQSSGGDAEDSNDEDQRSGGEAEDSNDEDQSSGGAAEDSCGASEGSESDDQSSEDEAEDFSDNLFVIKEDCINHVSKRVMKHLIKLKQEKTQRIPVVTVTRKAGTSSTLTRKQPATQQQLLSDKKRWGGKTRRMTTSMMHNYRLVMELL